MINTTKIRNFLSHHPRKSEKVSYQVYMGGQCIGLELDLDHFLEYVQTTFKLQSIGDGKALAVVKGVKDKGAVDICCRSFAGKCLGRNSEWNSRPTEFSFQTPREKALSFKQLGEEQQSSLLEGGTDVLVVTGVLPGLASSDREEETVYNFLEMDNGEAEIKSDDIGKVEEPFMRNNVKAEQDQDEIVSDDTEEFYKEALISASFDSTSLCERLEAKVDTDDPLMPKIVRPSNLRNKAKEGSGQAEVRSNNFQKAELREVKSSLRNGVKEENGQAKIKSDASGKVKEALMSMNNVKEEHGQADIESDNSRGFYNKESIRNSMEESRQLAEIKIDEPVMPKMVRPSNLRIPLQRSTVLLVASQMPEKNNLKEDSGQVEVKSDDFGKIKKVRTSMKSRNSIKEENSQADIKSDNAPKVKEAILTRDNLEESCQDEVDSDDSVMPQIVRPSKRNNAMGEWGQVEFRSDNFGNIKEGSATTRNTVELRKMEGNDDYSDVQHYNDRRQHQIHHLTSQYRQHYDQHRHQIHHHHHTHIHHHHHNHQHTHHHHHHHQSGLLDILLFLCALLVVYVVYLL